MGKLGWSGRCPACGARGRPRRAGGAPRRGEVSYLRRGWERGDPGWERGDAARAFQNGTLLAPPTHSPLLTGRPARAPWERGGKPACQTDRQKKPPYGEQWPKFLKEKKKKKEKKRGKKCLDQWGIYAKTHMICNVSMRICIRYHHPSCHPGSGSAESYKVKFSPLRRRRRNVIFRRELGGRPTLKALVTSQGWGVGSKLT